MILPGFAQIVQVMHFRSDVISVALHLKILHSARIVELKQAKKGRIVRDAELYTSQQRVLIAAILLLMNAWNDSINSNPRDNRL